jgi:hypothetical protein
VNARELRDSRISLCNLEYRTEADAERVVAWIGKQVTERSKGHITFEAEIFQDPEKAAVSGSTEPQPRTDCATPSRNNQAGTRFFKNAESPIGLMRRAQLLVHQTRGSIPSRNR